MRASPPLRNDEFLHPPKVQSSGEAAQTDWPAMLVVLGLAGGIAALGWIPVLVGDHPAAVGIVYGGALLGASPMVWGFALKLRRVGKPWAWAFYSLIPIVGIAVLASICSASKSPVANAAGAPSNYPRFDDSIANFELEDEARSTTPEAPKSIS